MSNALIVIYGGGLASLCALIISLASLWRGNIAYLPTLGWASFMALPFCIEYPFFNPLSRLTHAAIVFGFMALFLICDHVAAWFLDKQKTPLTHDTKAMLYAGYILGALFVGVSLIHIATVPSLPVLDALTTQMSHNELLQERIAFSRGYAFLPALKYLFNLSIPVFGMGALLLLAMRRRYWVVGALGAWIIAYSVLSTAKVPLVEALLIGAAGALALGTPQLKAILGKLYVVGFVGGLGTLIFFSSGHMGAVLGHIDQKTTLAATQNDDTRLMLGDYVRRQAPIQAPQCSHKLCKAANYLTYRVFMTPIEVSARWYEYFSLYPVQTRALSRLVLDSRTHAHVHPANLVGNWAYTARYPQKYSKNVYAYASMDADAYGRFGWGGIILCAFIYAGLRLGIALFGDAGRITGGIFGVVSVTLLGVLPASASIQAIGYAHGFALLGVIMGGLWAWDFLTFKRLHA